MSDGPALRAAAPPPPTHRPDLGGPDLSPTRALGRAILLAGLLLIGAVALGRVDLVVLAAPFALGTAFSLRRRPRHPPRLRLITRDELLAEGSEVGTTVSLGNADEVGHDLVVARALMSPWLRVPEGDRPHATAVPRGGAVDIELAGTALRWGRHTFGPAAAQLVAADGLLIGRPVVTGAHGLKVFPLTEPFKAVEAMPRAAGLVGGHRSRRPGEGGELAGVRMFGPGDRLRRIDWRVSLRTQQLHVAATLSDRDAEVVLLLDVLVEAGRSGGVEGGASVLDTTVRAAAAIAEHYLHRGDRVSLLEYGANARRLRPASGRRQYLTVLEWLLDVKATQALYEPYERVFGFQALSANALLVVLTPLIDERSGPMLARLARTGRFVVAVDTMPEGVEPPRRSAWTPTAYRLWRLERENVIGQLREHGVPVVPWGGAGSLDLVLRDVARLASAPRAALR